VVQPCGGGANLSEAKMERADLRDAMLSSGVVVDLLPDLI
jgi:hypothetical protein